MNMKIKENDAYIYIFRYILQKYEFALYIFSLIFQAAEQKRTEKNGRRNRDRGDGSRVRKMKEMR